MKKAVELPLVEPIYSTYMQQGAGSAVLAENSSVRNWYLNEVVILTCNTKFLSGYTSPEIDVKKSSWEENPHLEKIMHFSKFLGTTIHPIIRNFLDAGYYVCFAGIDDYYVKGKSWYKERHFYHGGMICGYNQEEKTYCLYAYDSNWVYQKFRTPQRCFEAGRKSMALQDRYGYICGIKPYKLKVEFSVETALKNISVYLQSCMEINPATKEEMRCGIDVHDYIAEYVDRLYSGAVPYERMDRRVFRLIWEHKKAMHERITCIESAFGKGDTLSTKYKSVVTEANTIRMWYASHHMKRRDTILPMIREKLITLKTEEQKLLEELLKMYF